MIFISSPSISATQEVAPTGPAFDIRAFHLTTDVACGQLASGAGSYEPNGVGAVFFLLYWKLCSWPVPRSAIAGERANANEGARGGSERIVGAGGVQ